MELYTGWLWCVFCIQMQSPSPPLAAFQWWLDSMVEFTNLFMPCAEHSINTSISMCISVIATRWPGWNLIQRTGRAEAGCFSAEKPSKATLLFFSSWHQHYTALCPPLVVPLYLGRGLCSDYPFKSMQSLPCRKMLRLMVRGAVFGSDMSHSSMVLTKYKEAPLHSASHSYTDSVCPWAMAISREQRLHHGRLFNSRKQWHGMTATPQKVPCCKSAEADCFVWLLYCPTYFAVCSSQRLFSVFSCLTCKQRNSAQSTLCAQLFREMMHVTLMQHKTLNINP